MSVIIAMIVNILLGTYNGVLAWAVKVGREEGIVKL